MRIGVNTRLLLKGKLEGIGYFQYELLKRMTKNHPEAEFVFFFDRKYCDDFIFSHNVRGVHVPLQARHPLLWQIYFDYLLPLYCKREKVDVFFSPENYIPRLNHTPIVCTIHDLNFYHNDYIEDGMHQKYFMYYFPKNAHKAQKIITVSKYSKEDIINSLHVESDKIDVIYNAASNEYYPHSEEINRRTKTKYTLGKDYFYFVGAMHKRKNLTGIFLAFDSFKEETKSDVKLIVIGSKKWWQGEIKDTYENMKYKDDVVFTDRLQADEVALISSASLGLVFPSLFEGFGIPVVEAFKAGCPVITSNTTSLPEVAGDAAIIVNPYNVNEIRDAMISIYTNPSLKQDLISRGLNRAKDFSWDKSAEKLWQIITNI